jgi:hypothetical protein
MTRDIMSDGVGLYIYYGPIRLRPPEIQDLIMDRESIHNIRFFSLCRYEGF